MKFMKRFILPKINIFKQSILVNSMKKATQKELFEFLNKKKIRYVVLRGDDEESKNKHKDLDILILKEDYERIKDKIPKTERILHFYPNEEKHFGIIFIKKDSLFRRRFDKEREFFVLSEKDYSRMKFFRKILGFGRKIKSILGFY